jgi:HAD superfamily hydrolase (TIGR01509 family)
MTLGELLAVKHPTAWVEFELDQIDEQELFERFFADGRSFDGPGLKHALQRAYRWQDGMEPLLEDLRARGVPMHALSNYPRWYALIERELRLSRYLSWTFVSCKTGVRKPQREAYAIAAGHLGVSPERCIFVDDRKDNCDAAAAFGMRAIEFVDAATLLRDFGAMGAL